MNQACSIVRNYLDSSGFTASFLLDHFQLPSLHLLFYPIGAQGRRLVERYQAEGIPVFLARVFIGGYPETEESLLAKMPATVFDALRTLRLLEQQEDRWQCPCLLFPYEGLFLTADRAFRGLDRMPEDRQYVAGGVDPTSLQFLNGISRKPCRTLLDMGTGSGLGALLASRFSERVWAVDLNARAVEYAAKNCGLNGSTNVTALASDLFGSLNGLRFDRIVANLPFVPSSQPGTIFAAGGEDGERILASFLGQTAAYLEPGGSVYGLIMGSDREDEPFENRIRKYLGASSSECDVALFVRKVFAPMEFAMDQVLLRNAESQALHQWITLFERFQIQQMVLATLILQRRATDRPVFTLRRQLSPTATIEDMETLVCWETSMRLPDFIPSILPTKPKTSAAWEALSRHTLRDGQMATDSFSILTTHPFEAAVECAPWVVSMASKATGELTTSQFLGMLQKHTGQPPESLLAAFSMLVGLRVIDLPGS